MIAFLDDHPLVRFPDGRTVAFERRWLEGCLSLAATRAGYERWWLASHVTESVSVYLRMDFEDPVVPVAGLEKAVKSVLQSIGYADVANHYATLPPPARLSLLQVAHEAGNGFELLFFNLLGERIEEVIDSGASHIECEGLEECAKHLRRAKNWRRDCSGLTEEIVSFVRTRIHRCKGDAEQLQIQLL